MRRPAASEPAGAPPSAVPRLDAVSGASREPTAASSARAGERASAPGVAAHLAATADGAPCWRGRATGAARGRRR
eukprot:14486582-Alexandrium_andersonii.AAC.1